MPVCHVLCAGGVAIDKSGRIALIVPKGRPDVVGLPKGHIEVGETPTLAALREVKEETGFTTLLDTPLTSSHTEYEFVDGATSDLVKKRVEYFRMRIVGGHPENHDHEVEDVILVTPRGALRRLTFANERRVVRELYPELTTNWRLISLLTVVTLLVFETIRRH